MSFILDALRKSETDRRRTATPMLAGIPVEVSRTVVPAWMWAVIVVLGIAVIGLGSAWWSSQRQPAQSGGSLASAPIVAAPEAGAPAPRDAGPAGFDTGGPRAAAAAEAGSPSPTGMRPSAPADNQTPGIAAVADTPAAATTAPAPSDPAPASAPVATPPRPQQSRAAAALPTLQEVRTAGVSVPELNLELHVYHSDPAARWVYINGTRYTEGRSLAAGPALREIVPEGVVLDYEGREFLLLAQ